MVQDLSLVWPSCMLIIFFYLICFVGFYLIESVGYEFFILIWSFLYPLKLWKGSVCICWMWFFLFWFDLFYILWNCEKARFELVGCEFFIWLELPRCTWSQAHSIILKEKYFQEEKCDQQQDHKMITSQLNYFKKKSWKFSRRKM